ncbi:hypothetical protein CBL_20973 [Carabus blaptoides fortunei]
MNRHGQRAGRGRPELWRMAQINLGKGKSATNQLIKTLADRNVDICMIQEPTAREGKVIGLGNRLRSLHGEAENPRTAICVCKTGIKAILMDDLSNKYITVIEANVTAATYRMAIRSTTWNIPDTDSLSDHRYIEWEITGENRMEKGMEPTGFCTKKADWAVFEGKLRDEMHEIHELIMEGNTGEQIEEAAGKVNEAIIKACTESMPRRKEFKGTVPWWTSELTEQRRDVRKLRKISQRAAATNDVDRDDKKRAYTAAFNRYKTALLSTRQDKWKEFCTDNSQHDPWGPAYRVLRRKKYAPNMTTVRREDGTTTDGWKETTELLLEKFFPQDKVEEDTPAQTLERHEAASTTGGANDRDITEAEIGRAIDIRKNRANEQTRTKAGLAEGDVVENTETELRGDHPATDSVTKFETGEPVEERVVIYTDGSSSPEAAGAAMVVFAGGREIWNEKYKLGSRCTAHQCELIAIRGALRYLQRHQFAIRKCAITTDCKQALQTIGRKGKQMKLAGDIHKMIINAKADGIEIKWYWTKAHTGIHGNERADKLAKEAATGVGHEIDYGEIPLNHIREELKTSTRRSWNARWQEAETGRLTAAFIPSLDIRKTIETAVNQLSYQTVQLITGHGNFSSYLKRFAKKESSICECGYVDETAEHVLFECELEEEARGAAITTLNGTGTSWPNNLREATLIAGRQEWWTALTVFASQVSRLKVDSQR